MICLQVTDLTKRYGETTVVDQLSFELIENTATALIGPNGAGKTTTLSMLTNLLQPTSGQIKMLGVEDIRKEIGFLPQYPQFFSWMTAKQFVEMAANLSGVPHREVKSRVEKMLEFVGLQEASNKKIGTFSGGMKQRLGIAQAIIHKPRLLLLDEPVSALDPVGRREMMDLLKQLQENTTILYSTHILNDAEQMTDQLLFLKDGRLVEQGILADIRKKYEEPKMHIEFTTVLQAEQFARESKIDAVANGQHVYIPQEKEKLSIQQLLQRLSTENYDIRKIEHMTSSLEEIFMKVAGTK